MSGEQPARNVRNWIATRVSTEMENGRRIMSGRLIDELAGVFHLKPIHEKLERKLKAEIERAKRRIRKQHYRWLEARKITAQILGLPEEMIERWNARRHFKAPTPQGMDGVRMSVLESNYYHNFGLTVEDIPKDHSQPLWGIREPNEKED